MMILPLNEGLRIHKKKLQNRLRRVLVFDTSRAIPLFVKKWGLVFRRVLVLIQVERIFFVNERSVCFIIQVRLIFGLKNVLLRVACALSYIQEEKEKVTHKMWITIHPILPFGCGYGSIG